MVSWAVTSDGDGVGAMLCCTQGCGSSDGGATLVHYGEGKEKGYA